MKKNKKLGLAVVGIKEDAAALDAVAAVVAAFVATVLNSAMEIICPF